MSVVAGVVLIPSQSARELTAASWAHDLAAALLRCEAFLSRASEGEDSSSGEVKTMRSIGDKMKSAMRSVWKGAANDVFDVG